MSVSHDDPKAGDRSSDRGRLLLNTLRLAGVPELFGIPSDLVLPLFQVIEDSAIFPLYSLSHEPAVGFAVDGAARAACRPSAAIVT
jgi:indolepyruvate decarboxylase